MSQFTKCNSTLPNKYILKLYKNVLFKTYFWLNTHLNYTIYILYSNICLKAISIGKICSQ